MRSLHVAAAENGTTTRLADEEIETRAGECRIRVLAAGICGTDLQILEGYAGFAGVPGHEFVGVVENAPDGDRHWIGTRVVGEINVGCQACEWCRSGASNHCPARSVLGIVNRHGAFATHLSLPADNLHPVPDAMDDAAAVLVEPTAAACEILTQVDIGPSSRVAVIGDGRMGLLVGQVLRATGAHVTLVGRHARKLKLASEFGLEARSASAPPDEKSFDVTVDVTGRAEGLGSALRLVRPRGTVVMKSTVHGETAVTLWPAIVDEVTLVGSRCGPFDAALERIADGLVLTQPLIDQSFPLDEHAAAFDAARTSLKVLLRPGTV